MAFNNQNPQSQTHSHVVQDPVSAFGSDYHSPFVSTVEQFSSPGWTPQAHQQQSANLFPARQSPVSWPQQQPANPANTHANGHSPYLQGHNYALNASGYSNAYQNSPYQAQSRAVYPQSSALDPALVSSPQANQHQNFRNFGTPTSQQPPPQQQQQQPQQQPQQQQQQQQSSTLAPQVLQQRQTPVTSQLNHNAQRNGTFAGGVTAPAPYTVRLPLPRPFTHVALLLSFMTDFCGRIHRDSHPARSRNPHLLKLQMVLCL
jgi:hypothetical protein